MLIRCAGCGGKPSNTKGQALVHCPICNHYWFSKPIGTKKYNMEYYRKYENYALTPLGQEINQLRWGTIKKYLNGSGLILDWGCGSGSFLRHSYNGYRTFGYDVNRYSPYKDKSIVAFGYDAVTMWDVVEHMEYPSEFISDLNTRLLVLLTPDATALNGKFEGWRHYRPDEHQHYFTKESIARFMERSGYKIREMNHDEGRLRDPKHPGWLMTVVGERA